MLKQSTCSAADRCGTGDSICTARAACQCKPIVPDVVSDTFVLTCPGKGVSISQQRWAVHLDQP